MAHVPHLHLPGPWTGPVIGFEERQRNHIFRVLRRQPGELASYTDGSGTVGEGVFTDDGLQRGVEAVEPPPHPALTLAVAPPDARKRQRFLVEKLAEFGIVRLIWLSTRYGQARPPRHDKAEAWARAGLEQSRGAWLMEISPEPMTISQLPGPLVIADPQGGRPDLTVIELTVAVGPEGGWAEGEIPPGVGTISLGPRILRVETAAIAAAAALMIS